MLTKGSFISHSRRRILAAAAAERTCDSEFGLRENERADGWMVRCSIEGRKEEREAAFDDDVLEQRHFFLFFFGGGDDVLRLEYQ